MRSPCNQAMERDNIDMDNLIQETYYMSVVTSRPDEQSNFNEAWNHQSLNETSKWREAIRKELYCMENKKAWRTICKTDVQKTED